jgi:hypothetical protein
MRLLVAHNALSRRNGPFVASSVPLDAWLLARPDSMAGPQAIKMLVRAEQNGVPPKKTGWSRSAGLRGLSLPAANESSA